MNDPRRILLLRGGALGDFLVTLPSLFALRERYAQAEFALVAQPAFAQFARELGIVREARSLESAALAPYFSQILPADDTQWARWFAGFDRIVSWLSDPDGTFRRNVCAHSQAEFLQGPCQAKRSGICAAAQFAAVLGNAEIKPVTDLRPFLLTNEIGREIALHPGSGSPAKNWPKEKWAELLGMWHLHEPSARFVIFSGEAEAGWANAFARSLSVPPPQVEHLHGASLANAARRLGQCALFLGQDSGFGHLAATLRIPSVLLFGPSDSSIWAPPSPLVQVVSAANGRVNEIPVAEVFRAALARRSVV